MPRLSVDEKQAGDQGAGGENDHLAKPDLRSRGAEAIECIGTLRREDDATRPRADSGGERQKTAQRRLKPRAYAYRRKPGRDEQEREIQNTHNSRKDVRRNRFCVAPAGPTLGKALAISRLHLAWFLSRDRLPAHKPAGSPSCSDLPFTGVRGRVLAQILATPAKQAGQCADAKTPSASAERQQNSRSLSRPRISG